MRSLRAVGLAIVSAIGLARAWAPASAFAQEPPESQSQTLTLTVAQRPAPDVCDRRWVEQLYPSVRRSVVRLKTVGRLGTGFVFGDHKHVATALHVVSIGRPVTVQFSDGENRTARAVAVDAAHDLAILELDAEGSAPPLPLAPAESAGAVGSAVVGSEVMVVGHPLSGISAPGPYKLEGLLDWSASRGIVTAKNSVFLQTDAAINPGNSGGPMLDCAGRVLGVLSWKVGSSLSFAVRSELLAALWARPRSLYMGEWSSDGAVSLLMHLSSEETAYMGLGLGLGGTVYDRVDYRLSGAYLWGFDPNQGTVVTDTRRRIAAQAQLRARLLIVPRRAHYIAVGGGLSYHHDLYRGRRFELAPIPDCTGPACQEVRARSIRGSAHSFRPLATVAWVVGGGAELGYSLILDAKEFEDSVHQIGLSIVTN